MTDATLKAGDTKDFVVGDQTLVVEPMPFGKLKKLIRIFAAAAKKFDPRAVQEDMLTVVPALVEEYFDECIPLLFDQRKNAFLTKDWIDDNLTVPKLKEIFVAAVVVNGLGDFFLKIARAPAPTAVEASSGTSQTPSESSGSITSSGSPTAGDPKTLTS